MANRASCAQKVVDPTVDLAKAQKTRWLCLHPGIPLSSSPVALDRAVPHAGAGGARTGMTSTRPSALDNEPRHKQSGAFQRWGVVDRRL